MSKELENTSTTRSKHDSLVMEVADMFGVTPRYVLMVRDGERNNDKILDAYLTLREALDNAKNELLQSVEQLVPFKKAPKTSTQNPA